MVYPAPRNKPLGEGARQGALSMISPEAVFFSAKAGVLVFPAGSIKRMQK